MINNLDIIGHLLLIYLILFFIVLFTLIIMEKSKLNIVFKIIIIIIIVFLIKYTFDLLNKNKNIYSNLFCFKKIQEEEVPIYEPFKRYSEFK